MSEQKWHDLTRNPEDKPEPGERVILCVGHVFSGEGWMKETGEWMRYCDLDPVEKFMRQPVVGWMEMPKPMEKRARRPRSARRRAEEACGGDYGND